MVRTERDRVLENDNRMVKQTKARSVQITQTDLKLHLTKVQLGDICFGTLSLRCDQKWPVSVNVTPRCDQVSSISIPCHKVGD